MRGTKKDIARKKYSISSPPVPIISLGEQEEKLLLNINKKKKFNINEYSDMYNIARSTTRSRLKKLDRIGLIYYRPKKKLGYVSVLKMGKVYLENIKKIRDDNSRLRGRKVSKKNELSSHWKKFSFNIEDMSNFRDTRLNFIDCSWRWNTGMRNWNELIIIFNDATVIIKTKTLIIEFKDMVDENVDEIDSVMLRRMVEYTDLLDSLGIKLGRVSVERGHWARVDSLLSDILYKKVGEKYYIEKDGKKLFWIDFSPDKTGKRKKEDEVPDKEMRRNLDYNIDQQLEKKIEFDKMDINSMSIEEIKGALGLVTKDLNKLAEIEKIKLSSEIERNKLKKMEIESSRQELIVNNGLVPSYIN